MADTQNSIVRVGFLSSAAAQQETRSLEDRGIGQRLDAYKQTYRVTRDPRAAVRSYCAGNVWLTENAKAVGNW